jgi:hypothetical protein
MQHIIITRFSIFDFKYKAFKITLNNNEQKYKDMLFSSDRLNHKFTVFEKITVPSVKNQTYKKYTWLIYASIYLPDKYKKKLENIIGKSDQIIVVYIDRFKTFKKEINTFIEKHKNFTTIRLDDDDGLHPDYLASLNKYSNCPKHTIISFPNGRVFETENNKIKIKKSICAKNNAQGLTCIRANVYACGNHTIIDQKYNVIYNDLKDAYYMCASEYCDTQRNIK